MAIDLSVVFNDLNIKTKMGESYTKLAPNGHNLKSVVLDKLYNLQAHLENLNDTINVTTVDTIIEYIEVHDKSLSEDTKQLLNHISQKTNFK
jgi:hypothetical protein